MLKLLSNTILSVSLILSSTAASASLVTNGSFEELSFTEGTTYQTARDVNRLKSFENRNRNWKVFSALPGWVTTSGAGIELQKNLIKNVSDGENYVELDSHSAGHKKSNSVMTQTIESLTVNAQYLLEFSYRPRTGSANDNGINLFWHDAVKSLSFSNENADLSVNTKREQDTDWVVQSIVLTADAETMNLSFGAFGKQNGSGGFVDNVSLVEINSAVTTDIPEPSVLALIMFGFASLVRITHKKAK
jgi:hypothetical protein